MSDNSIIHKAEIGLALTPMVVGGWYAAKRYNLFGSALKKGAPITPELARHALSNIPKDSPEFLKIADQLKSNRQAGVNAALHEAEGGYLDKLEFYKAKDISIKGLDTPENMMHKIEKHLGVGRGDVRSNAAFRLFKEEDELVGRSLYLADKLKAQFTRAKTPEAALDILNEGMRVGVLRANAPINAYMVNDRNFAAIDKAIAPYIRGNPSLLKGNATNIDDIRETLLNVHNYLAKNDPGELVTFHTTLENISKATTRGTAVKTRGAALKILNNSKLDPIVELQKRGLSEEVLSPLRQAHAEGKLKLAIQGVTGKTDKALKSVKYLKIQTEGGSAFRLHLPKKFGTGGRFYRDPSGRGFSLSGVVSDVVESNSALNFMGGDEFLLRKLGKRVSAGMYNLSKQDVSDFRKLMEYQHVEYGQTLARAKVDKVYNAMHKSQVVLAEDLNMYQPKQTSAALHRFTSKGMALGRSSKGKFYNYMTRTKDGRLVESEYLSTKVMYGGKETTIKELLGSGIELKDQPNFARSNLRTNLNVVAKSTAEVSAGKETAMGILHPTFKIKSGVISAGEVGDMQEIAGHLGLIKGAIGERSALQSYTKAYNDVRKSTKGNKLYDDAFTILDEKFLKKQASAEKIEAALKQIFHGNSLEKIRALAEMNEGEGGFDYRWAQRNIKQIGVPGVFGEMDLIYDYGTDLKQFKLHSSKIEKEYSRMLKAGKDTDELHAFNMLRGEKFENLTYQDQIEMMYKTKARFASGKEAATIQEALDDLHRIKRTGLVVAERGQKDILLRGGTEVGMQGGRVVNLAREPGYKWYKMYYTPSGVMSEGIGATEATKRWALVMSGVKSDRYKRINMDIEGGLDKWASYLRLMGEDKRAEEIMRLKNMHLDTLDVGSGTLKSHSKEIAEQIKANLTETAKKNEEGRYWVSHYLNETNINRLVGVQTGSKMPFTMEMGFELINGGDAGGELASYFMKNLEDVNPEKREFIENLNRYVTGGKFENNPLDKLPTVNESYMNLEGQSASQKIRNLTKGHTPELMGGYKYESKLTGENNILALAEKAGIEKNTSTWRQLENAARMETFYAPGTRTGIHEAVQEMNNSLRMEYEAGTTDRLLHVTDVNRNVANIAAAEENIMKAGGNTGILKSAISDYAAATHKYMTHPATSMGGKFGLMRNLGRIKESTFASVQSSVVPTMEKGRIVVEAGYETLRKMGMSAKEISAFAAAGSMPLEKANFAVFGYRFPITGAHVMELKIAKDLAANQVKVSFGGDMLQLMDRDNDIQTLALLRIGGKDGVSREAVNKYFEHQKAMIEADEEFSKKFKKFNFKQTMEDVKRGEQSGVLEGLLANAEGTKGETKIVMDQFKNDYTSMMESKSGWIYDRAKGLEKMGIKDVDAAREAIYNEFLMGKLAGYTQKRIITSGTIPTATSAKRLTFALSELGGIGAHANQVEARLKLNKFGTILQQVPIWGTKHIKSGEEAVDFALGVRDSLTELSRGNMQGLEGFFNKLGSTKMYQDEIKQFYMGNTHEKVKAIEMLGGRNAEQFAKSSEGIRNYFETVFEPVTTSLKTAFTERPEEANKLIGVMKNMMARKPGLGGASLDDYAKAVPGLNFGHVAESVTKKGLTEEAEAAAKMFAKKAGKAFGTKGFALGALATMGALTVMGMAQSPNRSGPIIPPAYRRRAEEQTPRVDMNTINNGGIFNKMMNWFNPEQPQGMSVRGQVNSSTSVNPEHVSTQINDANPGGRNNLSVQYRTDNLLSVRTKRRMKGEL